MADTRARSKSRRTATMSASSPTRSCGGETQLAKSRRIGRLQRQRPRSNAIAVLTGLSSEFTLLSRMESGGSNVPLRPSDAAEARRKSAVAERGCGGERADRYQAGRVLSKRNYRRSPGCRMDDLGSRVPACYGHLLSAAQVLFDAGPPRARAGAQVLTTKRRALSPTCWSGRGSGEPAGGHANLGRKKRCAAGATAAPRSGAGRTATMREGGFTEDRRPAIALSAGVPGATAGGAAAGGGRDPGAGRWLGRNFLPVF